MAAMREEVDTWRARHGTAPVAEAAAVINLTNNLIEVLGKQVDDCDQYIEAMRHDVQLLEEHGQRDVRELGRRLSVAVLERDRLMAKKNRLMAERDRWVLAMRLEQVEQQGLSLEEVEEATEERDTASGEEADCQICLAPMVPGEAALALRRCACRRAFHAACLAQWLAGSSSCPLCRGQAKATDA
jgi:hypothetical protein